MLLQKTQFIFNILIFKIFYILQIKRQIFIIFETIKFETMSTLKKPFGKIGTKLKKQKVQVNETQTVEEQQTHNEPITKPIISKLKLDSNKPKKNIYDAIKRIDQEQSISSSVHKPSLNFKKNPKLLKSQNPTQLQQPNQDPTQQSSQAPIHLARPTPVFNRNKGKLLLPKSKQAPIINQQKEQPKKNNRMMILEDQELEESATIQIVQQVESTTKLMKPNLFKNFDKKNKVNAEQKQEKLLNNSEVYQEYNKNEPLKEKFNFQKMMAVETAQINLQRKIDQVSQQKIEKQAKRARQLSNLLNLQMDIYQEVLSVSQITSFEVYISKIKGGFLKNSADQAFDNLSQTSCQTLSFESIDFSNQCPQDYISSSISSHSPQQSLSSLILTTYPIIQQLLKPSLSIIMPPTSLLAFKPTFKKFIKTTSNIFVYFSEQFNYSLLTLGQKLYIAEGEFQQVIDLGGVKVAGGKQGSIVMWNGQGDRNNHQYNHIKDIIQSLHFQLPVYVTNQFDRLSPYLSQGSIVSLLPSDNMSEFYSLDSLAKMIKWKIEKINRKSVLVPKQLVQFSKILQNSHLVGFGLKKRNQTFYVWTSSGLICWDGIKTTQKLQMGSIKDFYLPKRSNLIYCLSTTNSIQIYSTQSCISQCSLNIISSQPLQQLFLPQIQHQNRQISIFYQFYVFSSGGNIYQCRGLDNGRMQYGVFYKNQQQDGNRSKRGINIVYQGFTNRDQNIRKITIFKDFKCKTTILKMPLSLDKSVANLKLILTKNKNFVNNLNSQNSMLV